MRSYSKHLQPTAHTIVTSFKWFSSYKAVFFHRNESVQFICLKDALLTPKWTYRIHPWHVYQSSFTEHFCGPGRSSYYTMLQLSKPAIAWSIQNTTLCFERISEILLLDISSSLAIARWFISRITFNIFILVSWEFFAMISYNKLMQQFDIII